MPRKSFRVTRRDDPQYEELQAKIVSLSLTQQPSPVALPLDWRAYLKDEQLFLLRLQFTKLANYYGDQLAEVWGGDYYRHGSLKRVRLGSIAFLEMMAKNVTSRKVWIKRRDKEVSWHPYNFKLDVRPSAELGSPYEMYIGIFDQMLKVKDAARILCIDEDELVKLKLYLLLDKLVVDEAIRRMLRPRPEWPKFK